MRRGGGEGVVRPFACPLRVGSDKAVVIGGVRGEARGEGGDVFGFAVGGRGRTRCFFTVGDAGAVFEVTFSDFTTASGIDVAAERGRGQSSIDRIGRDIRDDAIRKDGDAPATGIGDIDLAGAGIVREALCGGEVAAAEGVDRFTIRQGAASGKVGDGAAAVVDVEVIAGGVDEEPSGVGCGVLLADALASIRELVDAMTARNRVDVVGGVDGDSIWRRGAGKLQLLSSVPSTARSKISTPASTNRCPVEAVAIPEMVVKPCWPSTPQVATGSPEALNLETRSSPVSPT